MGRRAGTFRNPIVIGDSRRKVARPYTPRLVRQYSARVSSYPETKYFDCGFDGTVTWAGTTWANSEVPMVNAVGGDGIVSAYTDSALIPSAIGSGYGQVIGNKYQIKKLRVRGQAMIPVAVDQADAAQPVITRILLVMDKQPNGVQAQGEEIMQDLGTVGENTFSFQRVAENLDRFRILKDQIIEHQPTTAPTDGTSTNSSGWESKTFSFQYVPRKAIHVTIKSAGSAPATSQLVNCNLFMLAVASGATTAGAKVISSVKISGSSRCYYCE